MRVLLVLAILGILNPPTTAVITYVSGTKFVQVVGYREVNGDVSLQIKNVHRGDFTKLMANACMDEFADCTVVRFTGNFLDKQTSWSDPTHFDPAHLPATIQLTAVLQ